MRQCGRGGIKEFGIRILRSNWHLGGTLALPVSQTTRCYADNAILQSWSDLGYRMLNKPFISADLGSMGDVVQVLAGGPSWLYVIGFGTLCVAAQIALTYTRYVSVLSG